MRPSPAGQRDSRSNLSPALICVLKLLRRHPAFHRDTRAFGDILLSALAHIYKLNEAEQTSTAITFTTAQHDYDIRCKNLNIVQKGLIMHTKMRC